MPILAGIDDSISVITGPLLILGIVVAALTSGYLKRRMRHKEIMAAIEKGMPLTKLKDSKADSPKWVRNIFIAIVCLIIGLSIISLSLILMSQAGGVQRCSPLITYAPVSIIGMIILAFGIGSLVRGLILKKVEKPLAKTEDSSKPL